tara:strand:+ start:546 stop:1175 length:630 start_codon:yes stop_codon:yes gene_type:complete
MLTAIGNVMRELHSRGWITTRDGNISLRRKGENTLYITPSGVRKTIIHPEHIERLAVQDDNTLDLTGCNPSGELHMHWLLQQNAAKTRAIVHAHPTHIIAAIYRGFDLQEVCEQFPEIFRYTRVGPTVPAIPAITAELGEATAVAHGLKEDGRIAFDIVGQAQHGVCSIGADPWTAFEHIERLNHVCEIVLASGVSPVTASDKSTLSGG